MPHKSKRPEEVFTPRAATVNEKMYIDRPELQIALSQAVRGSLHLVLFGESGTGKSWLYRYVFKQVGVHFLIANMANGARLGSLGAEFQNQIDRLEQAIQTSYKTSKEFQLRSPVAQGGLKQENTFEFGKLEPFEACLALLRTQSGRHPAFVVCDNLEQIFEKASLMEELANLIILLDDPRYAEYGVRLLLVGTPNDVKRYFAMRSNLLTVSNRLVELPEVSRMTDEQARDLIIRGFVTELGYMLTTDDLEDIVQHTIWVTDKIPQQIHEYCLELSHIAEVNGGVLTVTDLDTADVTWMSQSLVSNYTMIEELMNSRRTSVGRRNQVLYALGKYNREEFSSAQIERVVRKEFPQSTDGIVLNISGTLGELEGAKNPIIRRTTTGTEWRFVSPKCRMAIRAMLRKLDDETVEKVQLRFIAE